jgi:hypothetical protein
VVNDTPDRWMLLEERWFDKTIVLWKKTFSTEMATQKPVEWVSSLIIRFEEQVRSIFALLSLFISTWNRDIVPISGEDLCPFIHSPWDSVAVRRRILVY